MKALDKAQQLYQAGKYHEAITEFQNAITLQEGEEREGLYNIGCCYLRLKKWDKAEQYFIEAIKYKTNWYNCLFNLAYVLLKEKRFREAFIYCNRASVFCEGTDSQLDLMYKTLQQDIFA